MAVGANVIITERIRELINEGASVAKAIEDGANCLGYHYWGVIDNWSWCNAFKNRYGFVRVCLDDGYKRKEKKSASWIREVARTNEFE